MYSLIVTIDNKQGISKNCIIPWKHLDDLIHFKKITENHIVIMGRKTWELLPIKYKPLPNRINIVISSKLQFTKNKASYNKSYGIFDPLLISDINPNYIFKSIDECNNFINDNNEKFINMKKYIIGGESIYSQFLDRKLVYDIHIISMEANFMCDQCIRLPNLIKSNIEKVLYKPKSENLRIGKIDCAVKYTKYFTTNYYEYQFLNTMNDILNNGNIKHYRSRELTKSIFSKEFRFNLSNGKIPMTTTQPVSLKCVFEELMWILRGQTNTKILNNKNIHLWDGNTTREFLDKHKLNWLPAGDIGASYGFQMRRYGSKYMDCNTNYELTGFDQLEYVINLIINNPNSRQIIMNLWNPTQLHEMALAPQLYGYQFYVTNNILSCKLIQRSSNICLSGSHNCASGALLVYMICKVTGLYPGELIWSTSDIHIYLNQIESVKLQLTRIPKPFPTLRIKNFPKKNNILNFEYSDLELLNYEPFEEIKF